MKSSHNLPFFCPPLLKVIIALLTMFNFLWNNEVMDYLITQEFLRSCGLYGSRSEGVLGSVWSVCLVSTDSLQSLGSQVT